MPRTGGGPGRSIDLGESGITYLRTHLGYGGVLANLLLQQPLDRGRVLTAAFKDTDLRDDFDEGLDAAVSRLQWDFVIDLVVEFLNRDHDAVAAFEHPFATPDAKWLAMKPVPYVTCGQDVIFVIISSWARRDRVELALVTAGAQQEFGVLGHNAALANQTGGAVDPSVLQQVVQGLRGIILRAFDAEGYLVWLPADT